MTPAGTGRRGPRAWGGDLALGARLSVAGGRSGWARLALISAGVGLGVAMLLAATALPSIGAARADRATAQELGPEVDSPGPDTLLVGRHRSLYRGVIITGRLLRPEGDQAPVPPGVDRQLAPGEMVVSPALARLLESPEGAVLRDRWDAHVIGTIGQDGLTGPGDYTFYLGADLRPDNGFVQRIRSFGDAGRGSDTLAPVLLVLAVVGLVVLLLPVLVFITTAVRFGSEARERQLAAIRLVGADAATTRRVAAGETLVGTLLGLLLGGLLFLSVGWWVGDLLPPALGFFPSDLRPEPALVVLLVLLVPGAAVLVTLSALRRVVIEPLGVVRRGAERRRRLWWRLIPPAGGLALLYPLLGGGSDTGRGTELQIAAGVTLLLIGIVLLLPWLVQTLVLRLHGGGVAWQLAVRRLQLDSGTAVRTVSGIAVSVAGIIAVHGLFAAIQTQLDGENPPADRYQAMVYPTAASTPEDPETDQPWPALLAAVPGVRGTTGVPMLRADEQQAGTGTGDVVVYVAECPALRQYARVEGCVEGDSFLVGEQIPPPAGPGTTINLQQDGESLQWTVPGRVRTAAPYGFPFGATTFLVTPSAFGSTVPDPENVLVRLDPGDPDAIERLRNATNQLDPFAHIQMFGDRQFSDALGGVQQALLVGATALLLIVGASLLVNVLEQLRERRRPLAVLTAFGTRRTTLSGSVLYQVAIPVLLGLVLAVGAGIGLAAILQSSVDVPIGFNWLGIAGVAGAAALMVLAITAVSLPVLWRLTRPEGLRSE